jgi:hypothetical protein
MCAYAKSANDGPWDKISEDNAIEVAKVPIKVGVKPDHKNKSDLIAIDFAKQDMLARLTSLLLRESRLAHRRLLSSESRGSTGADRVPLFYSSRSPYT